MKINELPYSKGCLRRLCLWFADRCPLQQGARRPRLNVCSKVSLRRIERTDISARKAAPSKIDSFTFQELLKAQKKQCKDARAEVREIPTRNIVQLTSKARLIFNGRHQPEKRRAPSWPQPRAALKTRQRRP